MAAAKLLTTLLVAATAQRDCACDPSLGLACAEARIAPWERDWRDLRCDLRCCAEAATRALGWDAAVAAKGQPDPYGALVGGRSLRPFCDGELGWDRKRRAYAYRPLSPPPPNRAAVVVYFRGIGPGSRETRDARSPLLAAEAAARALNRSAALLIVAGDATFPPPGTAPVAGVDVWAANPGPGATALPLGVSAGPNERYARVVDGLLAAPAPRLADRPRRLLCRGYRVDDARAAALARVGEFFEGCGPGRLDRGAYFAALRESRFVLCPRGFGDATFRFYEALLAGAVPVVDTAGDAGLAALYADFPVVELASFDELSPAVLDAAERDLAARRLDLRRAFLPYWIGRIARDARPRERPPRPRPPRELTAR